MENIQGKRTLKQDIILGIFIALFGTIALLSALKFPSEAALFPIIVTALLIFLGAVLSITSAISLKKAKYPDAAPFDILKAKFPFLAYLIMLAYAMLIGVLGFYSSTLLFLICFMRFMNIKSIKTCAFTVIILLGFVYLLFNLGLHVNFPTGLLI